MTFVKPLMKAVNGWLLALMAGYTLVRIIASV
jgi:hypothetical protein